MEHSEAGPGPSSPEQNAIEQARFYLDNERWEQAESVLRQVAATAPDDPLPRAWRAVTLGQLNRREEGLQEARAAITLAPEWPYAHLVAGYLLDDLEKHKLSEAAAREALRLSPEYADAYALLAQSLFHQGRWNEVLQAAETGLESDAADVACANLRAMALTKLRRRDDASAALDTALSHDPENALTHANRGWALLEANRHREAMDAFKEALRLDPQQEWARQGILKSLNARNPVYRLMLGYFFWMSRLRPQVRIGIILGLWAINRVVQGIVEAYPAAGPYLRPLIGLYLLWVVLTWTAEPLFNLLLRFDPVGRHVLSDQQKRTSTGVGVCVLIGVAAAVAALVTQSSEVVPLCVLAFFLMMAWATYANASTPGIRICIGLLGGLLALITLIAVLLSAEKAPVTVALMIGLIVVGIVAFAIPLRRK